MKLTLQVVDGANKGRVYAELDPPVTIGRDAENLICLDDDRLSRFHARIEAHGDQFLLRDLNSTNGTRVNGEPVVVRVLQIGDLIALGRAAFVYGAPADLAEADDRLRKTWLDQASGPEPDEPGTPPTPGLPADLGSTVAGTAPDDLASTMDLDRSELEATRGDESVPGTAPAPDTPGDQSPPETMFPTQPILSLPELSLLQSARLIQVLSELHQTLADATALVQVDGEGETVGVPRGVWRRIVAVQTVLAHRIQELEQGARQAD